MSTSLFILLTTIILAEGLFRNYQSTQKLLSANPNKDFSRPICITNELQFPANFDAVVQLPANIQAKGLLFPSNGALILPRRGEFSILPDSKLLCDGEKTNEVSQLTQPKYLKWFDPKSWSISQQNEVKSIPHVERIPCDGDKVSMTVKSALAVDLYNVRDLSVSEVILDGREISSDDLQAFIETELGQMMFKSTEGLRVKAGSKAVCGCHASEDVTEYEYQVCSHLTESCPIPKCLNPIVPLGFCCPVCGAVFRMFLNDCVTFDTVQSMHSFNHRVEEIVTRLKFEKKIYGYGSLIREADEVFYQYVVVDADEYKEDSVQLGKELQKNFASTKYEIKYSGKFYAPGSGFSFWEIIFSTLLAVVAFFFVLYAYYERNLTSSISLPSWLALNRYRIFHSSFVFARFENHPAADVDAEVPGNIVIGLGQANEGFRGHDEEGPLPTGTTTSFHNPMFSEKEIKSTTATATGSSPTNAGSEFALKDAKESILDLPERRCQHVDNVTEDNRDGEDEEELVEVDLCSEMSSE